MHCDSRPRATQHTEERRALVRTQLRELLAQGINPLSFFDRDYKKYFYLAGVRMCVCWRAAVGLDGRVFAHTHSTVQPHGCAMTA
jgi:hypothetical protein